MESLLDESKDGRDKSLHHVSLIEAGKSILTTAERKASEFELIKKEDKFGVQTLESYQAYTELAGSPKI